MGQSQDCELRGLAERGRTRQLNGVRGMDALGASISWLRDGAPGAKLPVWVSSRLYLQPGGRGQLGDAENIR